MLPEEKNRREHLCTLAQRLTAASWSERTPLMQGEAERLGVSPQTLSRMLSREVGWTSGRKPRADKGSTSVDAGVLDTVASMKRVSVRQNGKAILPTTVSSSILSQNGTDIGVSNSQLNRLMRDRGMDVNTQKQASPHIHLRSVHPNHVHEFDPSLCVLYYLKGKQHMMRDDQFYKNKLDKIASIKFKVWRYVLVDHCSSLIVPWYVESAGESQTNLFDFLMYAWAKRDGFPAHGVPQILYWDKGSANTAHGIQNLCRALGVATETHAAGVARAKGGVENANNITETQFESRLRFEPVETVAELNAGADNWMRGYNANLLPNQDCRLRRGGQSIGARLDLWLTILAEQLRVLPARAVCAALMRGASATRKVRDDMTVTFKHPQAERSQTYNLRGCPGINVGDEVVVSPLVYGGEGLIAVQAERFDGEKLEYRVEPNAAPDRYGFAADAVTFGTYDRQPKTELEQTADRLDRVAYGDKSLEDIQKDKDTNVTPFAHSGALDAHSHLGDIQLPDYLPKRGTQIEVEARRLDLPNLTHVEAAKQLKARLGDAWTADRFRWLAQRYPEGVPVEAVDTIAADLAGERADLKTPLRAVGGVK